MISWLVHHYPHYLHSSQASQWQRQQWGITIYQSCPTVLSDISATACLCLSHCSADQLCSTQTNITGNTFNTVAVCQEYQEKIGPWKRSCRLSGRSGHIEDKLHIWHYVQQIQQICYTFGEPIKYRPTCPWKVNYSINERDRYRETRCYFYNLSQPFWLVCENFWSFV